MGHVWFKGKMGNHYSIKQSLLFVKIPSKLNLKKHGGTQYYILYIHILINDNEFKILKRIFTKHLPANLFVEPLPINTK